MRILVVCRSFHNMAGGIERMASVLMNEMCARGHDVALLTWDRQGAQTFYEFDPRISWHTLDMGSHLVKAGWGVRLRRMLRMRAMLREIKPDVILAFQHGTFISTRLYALGMGYPMIAAEREAPARFEHLKAGKWQWLIYQSMRLADRVTIQCESYRNDYPSYLRSRLVTIANPVFPAQYFAAPEGSENQRKTLLCVGRLGYQKNQGVLIEAFARLADDFSDWDLLLAGAGEDRSKLEALVAARGLSGRVAMPGAIKDTASLYCAAHLFCLPARWEGFPNVIAETLSHGLPAVGFAGCAGVRDLIEDGVNGALVAGNNDAGALAEVLRQLMADDALRGRMGKAGVESMKPFVPEKIFDRWEALLREVSDQ